jgi:hypothetical protein
MKIMKQIALFGLLLALSPIPWQTPAVAAIIPPTDIVRLEFTGGDVEDGGRLGRRVERLFDQSGLLTMSGFQSRTQIVDPMRHGHKTYSLFTSGFNGDAAPSATINGSSISVDLSSLFYTESRSGHFKVWSIGGVANGIYNPDTREFFLTWDYLFNDHAKRGAATFSLYGKVYMTDVSAVPISSTDVLFASGLAALLGMARWRTGGRSAAPCLVA